MHLLPRMKVRLDFTGLGPVELQGTGCVTKASRAMQKGPLA